MDEKIKKDINALDKSGNAKDGSLKGVLHKSEEIKKNVKKAADQISSVNSVLKQEEKITIASSTMESMIAQNEEAEQKVTKAAEDLHHVNTELAKQVAERIDIELELLQTKSELIDIRADLSKSQDKEKDALYIALHDPLTGLPNRLLLEQHLEQGLAQAMDGN